MSKLDDAMWAKIEDIVLRDGYSFCYRDFLVFYVNGKKHTMAHGTFRNKVSKLVRQQKVEVEIKSGMAFYTLKGYDFGMRRKNNSPEYHKQSITIYDKVLQLEPTNKKALHMKGVASYYLGKIPLANEYYDKVLSIDPDFGPSLYNKACNLSRLGKKDESLEYLQKAISSDQKYKHWASKDDAFKDLQTDPKFKKMTRFDF